MNNCNQRISVLDLLSHVEHTHHDNHYYSQESPRISLSLSESDNDDNEHCIEEKEDNISQRPSSSSSSSSSLTIKKKNSNLSTLKDQKEEEGELGEHALILCQLGKDDSRSSSHLLSTTSNINVNHHIKNSKLSHSLNNNILNFNRNIAQTQNHQIQPQHFLYSELNQFSSQFLSEQFNIFNTYNPQNYNIKQNINPNTNLNSLINEDDNNNKYSNNNDNNDNNNDNNDNNNNNNNDIEDIDSLSETDSGENDKFSLSNRKRRHRTSPEQLKILETTYEKEKMPGQDLREKLAKQLTMTNRRVQIWFQNKRAKDKRIRPNDSPKSTPMSSSNLNMSTIPTSNQIINSTNFEYDNESYENPPKRLKMNDNYNNFPHENYLQNQFNQSYTQLTTPFQSNGTLPFLNQNNTPTKNNFISMPNTNFNLL